MKKTVSQTEAPVLHSVMLVSLSVTGVIGLFELVTAVFVSTINVAQLATWLQMVAEQQLLHSPHSFLLILIVHSLPSPTLSASLKFITLLWLTIHGLTNVSLAYAVLRKRYWIYPLAITSFTLLTLYQAYLFMQQPNAILASFVVIGFWVVWLTLREYRQRQRSPVVKL